MPEIQPPPTHDIGAAHTPPLAAARVRTYAEAGVDIAAGERAVDLMRPAIAAASGMVNQFGAFGAAVPSPGSDMLLVSSADGVGTKLCLARNDRECAGLGRDLVHHCIDDILTCGARPIFFLDYLAFGKLRPERAAAIVSGMAAACAAHGAALVGGETAELPDIYRPDAFDVAGFIVGTVARDKLIDGTKIRAGNTLIGLPSAGLHTNGYSLARALLADRLDETLPKAAEDQPSVTVRDLLLAEHRSYLGSLGPLLDAGLLLGIAHITGGGLPGNVPRMLPQGLAARFDPQSWALPPIFSLLKDYDLASSELYRTFNMGIGMVLACDAEAAADVRAALPGAEIVGAVEDDSGQGRVVGLY